MTQTTNPNVKRLFEARKMLAILQDLSSRNSNLNPLLDEAESEYIEAYSRVYGVSPLV